MPIGFDEIQVEKSQTGTIITLKFREKIDKNDCAEFVPMLEKQLDDSATIRLLVELVDFRGLTAGAVWEDMKFSTSHFKDIEKLAVVGDKPWEKRMTSFFKPFTGATVRYFDLQAIDQAREWIESPT